MMRRASAAAVLFGELSVHSHAIATKISDVSLSSQLGEIESAWPWSRHHEKKAEPAAVAVPELGNPSQPGCYMRAPSGCPKNPMKTDLWRHDAWAEHHGLDEEGCKGRKRVWDKYCEISDSKVVFVGSETLVEAAPAVQLRELASWPWFSKRARAQEAEASAKAEAEATVRAEANANAQELGNPSQPGCYMRAPSGCPRNPMKTDLWRHDAWAEYHGLDEEGCKGRKQVWDKYCEISDSKVVFIGNATTSE
mmetsp:Transcript_13852/g.38998  ORF Transcript_13852/g.38998 Transcript_13852/m.38998 type:complete len:251 (+) Transcript_13852:79-831(+)